MWAIRYVNDTNKRGAIIYFIAGHMIIIDKQGSKESTAIIKNCVIALIPARFGGNFETTI